jgi:hypothetical protein
MVEGIEMKRIALVLALFFTASAPAAAQECQAVLKQGEQQIAENKAAEALRAFREAVEKCPPTRERVAAYQALAGLQLRGNDLPGAEATIEAARAFIVEKFGAEDLAMAANRQLHGVARLRRNDRDGARDAFAVAARIRNAKVDAWDESEGPMGAVGHKPSGLKLPARAGALVQFRRDINNDDGTDVSLGYRGQRAGAISVTLYIYRPQGEFRAIFEHEKQTIRSFNPQAILHREESQALDTKAGKIEGRLARYEYAAQGGLIGTRLYLFPLMRDYVKLRVTFKLDDDAFVDAQVAALLATVAWPAQ